MTFTLTAPRAVHHVLRDQHLVTSRHAPFNEDEDDLAHQTNCDQEVSGYAVVENDKMWFLPRCAGVVIFRYQDSGHKAYTSSMPCNMVWQFSCCVQIK